MTAKVPQAQCDQGAAPQFFIDQRDAMHTVSFPRHSFPSVVVGQVLQARLTGWDGSVEDSEWEVLTIGEPPIAWVTMARRIGFPSKTIEK